MPTIIIERNERAGDSWRKRYKSLCLHDPVWYDHLPYIPFPDNWPVFAPKDKVGDWLEMYTKVMELNYWSSTECQNASYDEAAGEWVVKVKRNGEEITLRPKQLVMATGMSGMPNVPTFRGQKTLQANSSTLASTWGRMPIKVRSASLWALITRPMTLPPRYGSTMPMSPCCSVHRPIL